MNKTFPLLAWFVHARCWAIGNVISNSVSVSYCICSFSFQRAFILVSQAFCKKLVNLNVVNSVHKQLFVFIYKISLFKSVLKFLNHFVHSSLDNRKKNHHSENKSTFLFLNRDIVWFQQQVAKFQIVAGHKGIFYFKINYIQQYFQ